MPGAKWQIDFAYNYFSPVSYIYIYIYIYIYLFKFIALVPFNLLVTVSRTVDATF